MRRLRVQNTSAAGRFTVRTAIKWAERPRERFLERGWVGTWGRDDLAVAAVP